MKWPSNFSYLVHLVSGWLREWSIMEASQNVGSNFRLIPGKHKGSKIYVKEPYTYTLDRVAKNPIDKQPVMYLKCRYPTCPARAFVNEGFLSTAGSKHQHNCLDSESEGMARISALELSAKMKMRAELEMTPLYVSIFCGVME